MNLSKTNLIFPINCCEELDKIVIENGKKIVVPMKQIFMNSQDEFDGIYYIMDGMTKHSMSNFDGIEKVLYFLTKGWFFGETAHVLGNKSTSIFSQAEIDTILYKIKSEDVDILLEKSKVFRDALFNSFAHKTIMLRYEIDNLLFNPCKDRLKRLLCSSVDTQKIIDNKWYALKIRHKHYELGVMIGSSRVTVSKLIKELCDEGFIRVVNRSPQVNIDEYKKYNNMIND